ncbi:RIP metalloprotease RseP [Flavobacteriaceae bacterium]|nr:RIP metalloprotease RseP [Flavobacteriaceae bacterium]
MSPFAVKAIQLLMSLSLLIILHELGHFIPARIFKTRVEKFFLFFDVKFALFQKKIGETTYGIGWLPLGGYVKISGMIDESMDTEQMQQPAQPWEFRSKPAWQRLIIMLGGVTVNLILGFLIYMMILFVWGKNTLYSEALPLGLDPSPIAEEIGFQAGDQLITVDGKALDNVLEINKFLFLRSVESVTVKHTDGKTEQLAIPDDFGKRMFESGELIPFSPVTMAVLDSVIPNSPAATAGLLPNDKILSIDGIQVQNWSDFKDEMTDESRIINLVYERNRSQDTLQLTTDIDGTLGVFPQFPGVAFTNKKLSLTESISEGFSYGYWTLHDYVAQFQYIFTQKGASQLGGFGAIGNMFPSTWNWKGFWASTALISIILAFMNILPIPALDGGHVMFLAYEIITGRKPNDKFMEYAQMFGFFLLLALVLYANGNDLYRLIFS